MRNFRNIPLALLLPLLTIFGLVSAPIAFCSQNSAEEVLVELQSLHESGDRDQSKLAKIRKYIHSELREEKQRSIRASWLKALAFSYFFADDYGRSVELLKDALAEIEEADGVIELKAELLQVLGCQTELLGDLAESRRLIREGISLAKGGSVKLESIKAALYFSLANSYLKTNDLSVAKRYFELAERLAVEQKDELTRVTSRYKLGDIARASGVIELAIQLHSDALEFYSRESPYRVFPAVLALARDYLLVGQFDQAMKLVHGVAYRSDLLSEQQIEAFLLLVEICRLSMHESKCSVSEQQRWISESASSMARIESVLHEDALPKKRLYWIREAIYFYSRSGEADRALEIGEEFLPLIARQSSQLSRNLENHRSWLVSAVSTLDAYIELLEIKEPEYVLDVIERFYDLARHILSSSKHASDFASESLIQRDLARSIDNFVRLTSDKKKGSAESRLFALHERDAAEERLRQSHHSDIREQSLRDRVERPENRSTLATIQQGLRSNEVYLRCHAMPQHGFCLVVTKTSVSRKALPGTLEILEKSALARSLASDLLADSDDLYAALRSLGELFPTSELAEIDGIDHIILSDNGLFDAAPLAAANVGVDKQYEPLISTYQLTRVTSGREYFEHSRSDTRSGGPPGRSPKLEVVVFANPDIGSVVSDAIDRPDWFESLPPLIGSELEAQHIERLFSKIARTTLFTGHEASREAFLGATTRDADLLHIATHSYFNPEFPEITGFVVAKGATDIDPSAELTLVSMDAYNDFPLSASLVVVSGCESLRGRRYPGVGTGGIGRSFLDHGALNAVGSIWKIPDAPTAKFMQLFYEELYRLNGKVAQSLRSAQSLMRLNRRYRHPLYWAGFELHSASRSAQEAVFDYDVSPK